MDKDKQFFVYLLLSSSGATYVGATVDLNRRLRQHNKEIKGGAHATSARVIKGEIWTRACHIRNFPDWQSALQFEWKWKQLSRKKSLNLLPLERRIIALKEILLLDKTTFKAKCFSEWDNPPEVILESVEAKNIFYK